MQKGLGKPARGRTTSFLTGIPTYRKARAVNRSFLGVYRYAVTQEQYSFKGMCDVDACKQSHLIALSWGHTDMQ